MDSSMITLLPASNMTDREKICLNFIRVNTRYVKLDDLEEKILQHNMDYTCKNEFKSIVDIVKRDINFLAIDIRDVLVDLIETLYKNYNYLLLDKISGIRVKCNDNFSFQCTNLEYKKDKLMIIDIGHLEWYIDQDEKLLRKNRHRNLGLLGGLGLIFGVICYMVFK